MTGDARATLAPSRLVHRHGERHIGGERRRARLALAAHERLNERMLSSGIAAVCMFHLCLEIYVCYILGDTNLYSLIEICSSFPSAVAWVTHMHTNVSCIILQWRICHMRHKVQASVVARSGRRVRAESRS